MPSPITTHVLDTSLGKPAAGLKIVLDHHSSGEWKTIGHGMTDDDGRIGDLLEGAIAKGHYRLTFNTANYFELQNVKGFYPQVQIDFEIDNPDQHYHVPLLLNPFGYSTYRGS